MTDPNEVNIPIKWVTLAIYNGNIVGITKKETTDIKSMPDLAKPTQVDSLHKDGNSIVWTEDGYGFAYDAIQNGVEDAYNPDPDSPVQSIEQLIIPKELINAEISEVSL